MVLYRLHSPTRAVVSETFSAVTIPPGETVELLRDSPDEELAEVSWRGDRYLVFDQDLNVNAARSETVEQ